MPLWVSQFYKQKLITRQQKTMEFMSKLSPSLFMNNADQTIKKFHIFPQLILACTLTFTRRRFSCSPIRSNRTRAQPLSIHSSDGAFSFLLSSTVRIMREICKKWYYQKCQNVCLQDCRYVGSQCSGYRLCGGEISVAYFLIKMKKLSKVFGLN